MKYFLLCFIVLQSLFLNAQFKKVYFQLTPQMQPVEGALYNEIEVADVRHDTADLGLVDDWGAPSVIVPRLPFQVLFRNLVASRASNESQGKLFLVLRSFQFVKPDDRRFLSFVYLRADVFAANGSSYKFIGTIDNGVDFPPSASIKKMMKKGEEMLTHLIDSMIIKRPSDEQPLSLYEAMHIDSVMKSKIRLYNSSRLTDGLYLNWHEFATQRPAILNFTLKRDLNRVTSVSTVDTRGRDSVLSDKSFFAVVENGVAYASCQYGLFPVKKVGDDFFFNAISKEFNGKAYLNHGVIGGLASGPDVRKIRYVLAHWEGKFLRSIAHVNMN